jgi:hypothetical protein
MLELLYEGDCSLLGASFLGVYLLIDFCYKTNQVYQSWCIETQGKRRRASRRWVTRWKYGGVWRIKEKSGCMEECGESKRREREAFGFFNALGKQQKQIKIQ